MRQTLNQQRFAQQNGSSPQQSFGQPGSSPQQGFSQTGSSPQQGFAPQPGSSPSGWSSQYYQPPGFSSGSGGALPSNSQTIVILTWMISIAGCFISPFTTYLAKKELGEIEAGRADPSKKSTVQACYYINLVVSIVGGTVIVGYTLLFIVMMLIAIIDNFI